MHLWASGQGEADAAAVEVHPSAVLRLGCAAPCRDARCLDRPHPAPSQQLSYRAATLMLMVYYEAEARCKISWLHAKTAAAGTTLSPAYAQLTAHILEALSCDTGKDFNQQYHVKGNYSTLVVLLARAWRARPATGSARAPPGASRPPSPPDWNPAQQYGASRCGERLRQSRMRGRSESLKRNAEGSPPCQADLTSAMATRMKLRCG